MAKEATGRHVTTRPEVSQIQEEDSGNRSKWRRRVCAAGRD